MTKLEELAKTKHNTNSSNSKLIQSNSNLNANVNELVKKSVNLNKSNDNFNKIHHVSETELNNFSSRQENKILQMQEKSVINLYLITFL